MEIRNYMNKNITLNIAKRQTLQYWVKRVQEVLHQKKRLDFSIDYVELLSSNQQAYDETFYYAIAHIDQIHPVFLCMSPDFIRQFVFENTKEIWDEFDVSMANSSLNDIISNLRMRPKYHIKKYEEIIDDLKAEERLEIRFNYKLYANQSFFSLIIHPSHLDSYLNRYYDPKSKNLDIMMDVPVTVRVELGSLQKKVKEIMEFTQGTLIELDQTVDSNCKVIVNNHVIAQGEVVEVNGNFGVMMTKIDDNVDFMK